MLGRVTEEGAGRMRLLQPGYLAAGAEEAGGGALELVECEAAVGVLVKGQHPVLRLTHHPPPSPHATTPPATHVPLRPPRAGRKSGAAGAAQPRRGGRAPFTTGRVAGR
jgi:hypothetical protein